MKTNTLPNFLQFRLQQKLLLIAIPMILSNVTTPLMGLVDTAVLGHMTGTHFLAGASVAALIVTQLYWLCGFIRMSSTGLSAQAKGIDKPTFKAQTLLQSVYVSFVLGCLLWLLQDAILFLGLYFANTSDLIAEVIRDYFQVRIYGAPGAMLNLALIGWLIGQQKTKQVLYIQIAANLLNVVLNLWFVFGLELDVFGVALATVCAEYFITGLSLLCAFGVLGKVPVEPHWLSIRSLRPLLSLNANTFLRNLILQGCIAFLIFQGVGFGASSAAINAILMQFFSLIALGLDGIAYSAEALVGEEKGKDNPKGIKRAVVSGLVWSNILAVLYSLVFYFWGHPIVGLLTNQTDLQLLIQDYLIFIYLLPLIAHWCFFFDGVFVGLSRAVAMRNTILISAIVLYFPVFYLYSHHENKALWVAMLLFMLARGVSLGGYFIYLYRTEKVAA